MKIVIANGRTLRDFLRARATRDASSVSAYRRPMGFQQLLAAGLSASTPLTLPAGVAGLVPGYAIIQCEGATSAARWRDDGQAPTAAIGMTLNTGQELDYSGDLTMLRFIVGTGSPTLNISYYA